ncbi:26264_t:CDS:2, partial [Racocetra persica]
QAFILDYHKDSAFREMFSTKTKYLYSPQDLKFLTNKMCLFLLSQFRKIYKKNEETSLISNKIPSLKKWTKKNLQTIYDLPTLGQLETTSMPSGYSTLSPPLFDGCDYCHLQPCSLITDSNLLPTMFRESFSYKNDTINVIVIDNNILVKIQRVDQNVARIYFTNGQRNSIRILAGITLRDLTNNTNVPRIVAAGAESYMITWVTNYELWYNGGEVLNLDNQKQQSMRVPPEYATYIE